MDKKKLKERWKKAKSWCKDHGTEILCIVSTGLIGSIVAGNRYKKGWDDAIDKCVGEMEKQTATIRVTNQVTPRDFMTEEAVAKTMNNKEDGAGDCLDKPIKEIMFWF